MFAQGGTMKRFGQVIGVKPEHIAEYERLHAAVWPGVLEQITACNIRNYSIYRFGETLFAYFEYHGTDFEADMARMSADPTTQEWWAFCIPMQTALEGRAPGEHWATMPEVFHHD
jgi:L-rhamnose mutarotase